jgi:hypothetical protein
MQDGSGREDGQAHERVQRQTVLLLLSPGFKKALMNVREVSDKRSEESGLRVQIAASQI